MAQARVGTLHFVEQTVYKAEKALVAAKFNGINLNTAKFDPKKDGQSKDFLAMNPTGKVPYLETDMVVIFTSNSIARFVARCRADTSLFGKCFDDENEIDTLLEFCTHELEVPLMTWVYPTMGLMQDNAKATADAQADVKKALQQLESKLAKSTYLIGDFLTLADIVLVCTLREGFSRVFDPAFRKPFPKTTKWFETCCQMPQFKSVFSAPVKLATEMAKPVAVKGESAAPAKGGKNDKKESPKAAPKAKEDKKKASPKAAPAKAPAAVANGVDVEAKVKEVGDKIRELKEKLKGEGLSGKKINDHEEIKALVAELQTLKTQMPAADAAPAPAAASPKGAAKSPPKSPAKAPAPAAGGDVEAQIKDVGDQIRVLKEKLKGEGLSGKKINDHSEVKDLVAKLQELKAKL